MMRRLLLALLICSLLPAQISPVFSDPIIDTVFFNTGDKKLLQEGGVEFYEYSHLPFIRAEITRGIMKDKILATNQMAHKTSYYSNELINLPYQNELIDSDFSVAILDTGIDEDHELLEHSEIIFKDFVYGDEEASDPNGHGTQVASIIAGYDQSKGYKSIFLEGNFSIGIKELFDFSINITSDFTASFETDELPDVYIMGDKRTDAIQINTTFRFPSLSPGSYQLMYDSSTKAKYNLEINYLSKTHFSGVAPGANIISVKVLDDKGDGDISSVLDAINWVITNRDVYNISVVNMSFSFDEVIGVVDESVNILRLFGIIPVVAAGNNDWDGVFSPASASHAITVGAVGNDGRKSSYSSIGTNLNNSKPNIYAPGGDIVLSSNNLFTARSNDIDLGDDFSHAVGTSFAAPHVAGALLILINEYIKFNDWIWYQDTVDELKQLLYISSRDIEPYHIAPWGVQWGLLDLTAAMELLNGSNSLPMYTPINIKKDESYFYNIPLIDPAFPIYINTQDADMNIYNLTLDDPLILPWDGLLYLDPRYGGLLLVITSRVDDVISISDRAFADISWAHDDIFIPDTNYILDFRSTSGYAEIFVNDTSIGDFFNRDDITLQDGMNNITAVETAIGGGSDADSVLVYVDLDDPVLNITDIIIPKDGEYVFKVDTFDNNLVTDVEIYVDDQFYNNYSVGDDTLEFFPYKHSPGEHNISIVIIDIANRVTTFNMSVDLNHTDFVVPLEDQYVLTDRNLNLIWDTGSDAPDFYEIEVENEYGSTSSSEAWTGSDILFNLAVEKGVNRIRLIVHSFIKVIEIEMLIFAFDVFNPELEFPDGIPDTLDMTFGQTLSVSFNDYNLSKILIFFKGEILINDTDINKKTIEYSITVFSNYLIKSDLLLIKAWDEVGNRLMRRIEINWQDLTPPEITPMQELYIYDVGTNFSLEFTWVEKFDEHIEIWLGEYKVFDNKSIGWTTISFDYLDPGFYEIELKVFDIGGNMASIMIEVEVKGFVFSVITQSSPISIVFVLGLFWRRKR